MSEDVSDIITEKPFKVALEEMVLEMQRQQITKQFALNIAEGNEAYALEQLKYMRGEYQQAKRTYEFVKALYENAICNAELIKL